MAFVAGSIGLQGVLMTRGRTVGQEVSKPIRFHGI